MTEAHDVPYRLHRGNVINAYRKWPTPATIISDGAYGVRGFHGDTNGPEGLAEWYAPHIAQWTRSASPATTLWFWNTEVGWATVHPHLEAAGWEYVELVVWDKGIAHIAGNVNGRTVRRFPVTTEVCAFYQRRPTGPNGEPMRAWLRGEWQRAGLALQTANEVCGVKNAATRKYLTQDHMWYFPPGEMFELLAEYANRHGAGTGWPYFSLDGATVPTAKEWDLLRYRWTHQHGLTNVWQRGPLHDSERLKGTLRRAAPRVYKPSRQSAAHLNQKPLEFMERLVRASTSVDDVVWEPFGGLASASVAAIALGRRAYVAEMDTEFATLAVRRLELAAKTANPREEEIAEVAEVPVVADP